MKTLLHLLLLSSAAIVSARAADPAPQRPNILFIVVDDLRPELGCYGKDYIQSPNIDGLAKTGIVFERAYCQQAVCSPTRSSLLTGTRPDTTKVWDLVTHFRAALPDVVTLPQLFKNNGYFVQGMGKIYHGGYDDPQSWSVPFATPKAAVYALPENVALNARRFEVDPDDETVAAAKTKKGGKGKGKAAAAAEPSVTVPDSMPAHKNIRGPAFEAADARMN